MATQLTAQEVRTLADTVASEIAKMQRQSARILQFSVIVGIILFVYLGWAFHRIAVFVAPDNLADWAGDVAVGQAKEIVIQMGDSGAKKAPELVAQAEEAVIGSVPNFREQLETTLKSQVGKLVKETLEGTDQAMVEELANVPDSAKLIVSAQKKPEDAAKLYSDVEKLVVARKDVKAEIADAMTELNKLRDHLRTLRDNRALSPSERAERRLLQVVLAKAPMPAQQVTPAPAAVKKK